MYPWFQSDPLTLLQHSLHTQSLARDIIRGIYVRASHKLRTTRFFWDDRLGNVDRKLLSHREEFNRLVAAGNLQLEVTMYLHDRCYEAYVSIQHLYILICLTKYIV